MKLLDAADQLSRELARLRFAPPVTHVYNPLLYAREGYAAYLRAAGEGSKRVVFLGMNPGPFGMAQTGVPFGDAGVVRDWLGFQVVLGRPEREHPKRLITGLACPRSEVSGTRVWGLIREAFETPAAFFREHFIANYCPCCFMEESGRNRTPDKLPPGEREPLYAACDRHLRRVVELLEPQHVIGIGAFAADRARRALEGTAIQIGQILHPSPASPRANEGWDRKVKAELRELGVCPPGGCAGS